MSFTFIPIKTRIVQPPKDEVWDILDTLPPLLEKDIVFITSKILAIHQGRCLSCKDVDKNKLINQEATFHLPYQHPDGFNINLTITDNILIPAAGIDESNADGHYILWPNNVDALCKEIRAYLCNKNNLKELGVVSTDSHTTPLRWGTTGITTGLSGVEPLEDIRGIKDLFDKEITITQINKIDPITSMAVALMGETNESTPIIILRGYNNIVFNQNASMDGFKISPTKDLYAPLFSVMKKKT